MKRRLESLRRMTMCAALASLLAGCNSPFPSRVRKEVQDQPSFGALARRPSDYRGRLVLLGGVIVGAGSLHQATLLEIVQERLDSSDRPIATDRVGGRFLARSSTFLDPSVYCEGRDVTVLGRVAGRRVGRIGDRPYTYPLIAATEIRLWPKYGGLRDSPGSPRRDWVWGYPATGWSHTWGSVPPITFPHQ